MDEKVQHIMQSDLPNALQLTWIAMWGASNDGIFADSMAEVGRERGISRQAAHKQVQRLVEWGAAEKIGTAYRLKVDVVNLRVDNRNPKDDNVNPDEKGFPLGSLRFSPKKVHSTPISPSLLTPSQVCVESPSAPPPLWLRPSDRLGSVKEPIPDDHPARWEHQPGDWTFEFGKAALVHMRELDLLTRTLENDIERLGEDRYVATKWADTFRLIKEQDGYSKEEIRSTLEWLFEGGNFWTDAPAIRSVPPLRKKTDSGDARKFDVMYQQAHSDSNGQDRPDAKQRPDENWERISRAAATA